MPAQRRVVGLDIDPHFVFQAKPLEKAVNRLRVEIVLVLGRLVRFGLDQDRAGKPDLVLVFDHEIEEPAEIFLLDIDFGVENCVVAFAATPQHIIGAAEPVRRFQRVAHLHRGPAIDFGIGIGCGACHIARVAEQVGRAPQQFAAMLVLQRFKVIDRFGKAAAERADVDGIGHDIDIVKTVERHIELFDERQRGFALGPGGGSVIGAGMPGAAERACAKHIAARPAECVPEAHGEAQLVLHALAQHHAVLVIPAIGEIVRAAGAFKAHRVERGEIVCGHGGLLLKLGQKRIGGAKPRTFRGKRIDQRRFGIDDMADRRAHADIRHAFPGYGHAREPRRA